MNKKFSTLVASMLLATTVGTVSAQSLVADFSKSGAPLQESVNRMTDGRAYQLSNGNKVLVMQKVSDGRGGYTYQLAFIPFEEATVGESLWYVNRVKTNAENGIAFQFINLAYKYPISFDLTKVQDYLKNQGNLQASNLGGDVVAWSWMRSESGPDLKVWRTPEMYFNANPEVNPDSVLTMVPTTDGKIAAVKYAVSEVEGKVSELNIRPYVAGPIWLNKFDLNTMLQTQKENMAQFYFEKGTTGTNLWDETPYKAVDAVAENTLALGKVEDANAEALEAKAEWEKALEMSAMASETLKEHFATWNQLWNERSELERTVAQQKEEQEKALAERDQLESQAINLGDMLLAKQSELASLSQASEESQRELANWQEEKKKRDDALIEARNRLAQQISAIEGLNTTIDGLESDLNVAQVDKEANQALITWIKGTTLFKSNTEGKGANKRSLGWLRENYVTGSDKVDAEQLEKNIQNVLDNGLSEAGFDKFVKKIEELYSEETKDDLITFSGGYSDVNSSQLLVSLIEDRNANNADIASLPTKIEELESIADSYVKELSNLQDACDNAQKSVDEAQMRIDEWLTTNASDDAAYQEMLTSIAALQESYNAVAKEFDDKIIELLGITADIQANREKIAELSDQIAYEESEKWEYFYAAEQARSIEIAKREAYFAACRYYVNLRSEEAFHWLSLQTEDGKNYLMVDTAYATENAGDQNLKFKVDAYKEYVDLANPMVARDVNGRFNFRFFYYPTYDSLRIEADGFNRKNVTTKWWSDRTDSEITLVSSRVSGQEQNLVKVDVLGNERIVTVGNSENLKGTDLYTINDRIGLNIAEPVRDLNVPEGLYYMDVIESNTQENGARLMLDLEGGLTKIAPADTGKMMFAHLPAAKWYVETTPTEFGGYPDIYNLESGKMLNNGIYTVAEGENEGEYVVTVEGYLYQNGEYRSDKFLLKPAPESAEGYYRAATTDPRELFTMNYLSVNDGLNIEVGDETINNDSVLVVTSDSEDKFRLERVGNNEKYGYNDELERGIYKIKLYNPNKLEQHNKYVQITNVDGTEMMVVSEPETATNFYLKEMNHDGGNHYYALINAGWTKKAGVVDATGLIKAEDITAETRTSAFALLADTTRYYREFTTEELGENNILKFYRTRSTEKEYLYAAAPVEDMTFLAVEDKGNDSGAAAEMTVIPTTEAGVLMPQYLIARNVVEKAGDVKWCEDPDHKTLADSLACVHTRITPDTLFGQFLVNLKVDAKYAKYDWEGKYTRLAFLDGYAVKDTKTYPVPGTGEYSKVFIDNKEVSAANKHDAVKFEFRLINDNDEQDFLIESESYRNNDEPFAGSACPTVGGWVKVQNGVPVIVSDNFENLDASSADIYNVDTNIVDDPTANDEISTSEVKVIAGAGQITINGAAGKKVVVSNILGQVVANTVLTSDNATIAAPQGVVVVAVEGEEAVKAIVK